MCDELARFVDAQAPVYERVESELRAGRKRTHWMWFIFPQLRGLGSSPMAHRFGIASLDEARAYLRHPVLSTRLRACTRLVLEVEDRRLVEIFGEPDGAKFRSSMTLFTLAARAEPGESGENDIFSRALFRYCDGTLDERTVASIEPT